MNISRPFETLVARAGDNDTTFDCLIIGSGYGGSMAANTLSKAVKPDGSSLDIAVLEKGREYLPGDFPAGLNEVFGDLNNPAANRWESNHDSLYDVHQSETHWVLGGSGVGGGSLINAGVMLPPDEATLNSTAWPASISKLLSNKSYMDKVGTELGSRIPTPEGSIENTVTNAGDATAKYHSLEQLGRGVCDITATPLTIRLTQKDSEQYAETSPCINCGNCFSGCNFNAKKSLDTNVLGEAFGRGVNIYNGAQVLYFEKEGDFWIVHVVFSNLKLRRTQAKPLALRCRNLIISAGAVASTELLIRSGYYAKKVHEEDLFSDCLGKNFFGNGDMIASVVNREHTVNMIADDAIPDEVRNIGPTNSGMLDFRHTDNNKSGRLVYQELAVPGVLQRAMIEGISFTQVRDALTSFRKGIKTYCRDFIGLSKEQVQRLAIVAAIGGDNTPGQIVVSKRPVDHEVNADNYQTWLPDITIKFENTKFAQHWLVHRQRVLKHLQELLGKNDPSASLLENPIGNPLGDRLSNIFPVKNTDEAVSNGWLMTVHPLGGCSMADSVTQGVVNPLGQVFKKDGGVYSNLAVLDGAIVPCPVNINPAMTIAAIAHNASRQLAGLWNYSLNDDLPAITGTRRETAREIKPAQREKIYPTEFELNERLIGEVKLNTKDGPESYIAELRLRSEPFELNQYIEKDHVDVKLLSTPAKDTLNTLPDMSRLRLFEKEAWEALYEPAGILANRKALIATGAATEWTRQQRQALMSAEKTLGKIAVLDIPVTGQIAVLKEVAVNPVIRLFHGAVSWWIYRGRRDRSQSNTGPIDLFKMLVSGIGAWFHAGRKRQFIYELKTASAATTFNMGAGSLSDWTNQRIAGVKNFRFGRHSNPLTQLMSIELQQFPNAELSKARHLKVDLEYFIRTKSPLIQVYRESDSVTGYGDLLSFGTWVSRVTLLQFLWLLRKPDLPDDFPPDQRPAPPNKRPVNLPDLSEPVHCERYKVADPNNKYTGDTHIRLSRFRHENYDSTTTPVLCIHGFSLGWSMFAHNTLFAGTDEQGKQMKGGLAAYLARRGLDVWVIDLRTSGYMPTAKIDWDFEEAAFIDIPKAIEIISEETGHEQVDIMAHCMGALKVSMLLMCSEDHFKDYNQTDSLAEIRRGIRRVALSQAGPYVRFSEENLLRERVLSVVKNLPDFDIEFMESDAENMTQAEEFADRLLNAMPYPAEEIALEHPSSGNLFWVRGRHRMDAIYGKTFLLRNMDFKVLDRFHDFFGKFSLKTLEQVSWFARRNQISDTKGGRYSLDRTTLRTNWTQETLWIHGRENELFSPMSAVLTQLIFDEAQMDNLNIELLDDFGHQDCMMGSNCELPFGLIYQHFTAEAEDSTSTGDSVFKGPANIT